MPHRLKNFLEALAEIKGHLTVVMFLMAFFASVAGTAWAYYKPTIDAYYKGLMSKQGFATVLMVSDLTKEQKKITETQNKIQEDINNTKDNIWQLRGESTTMQQRIEDLIRVIEKQDEERATELRELRSLIIRSNR